MLILGLLDEPLAFYGLAIKLTCEEMILIGSALRAVVPISAPAVQTHLAPQWGRYSLLGQWGYFAVKDARSTRALRNGAPDENDR